MATILVVDDRPTNRAVLAALLGPGGNRVIEARNGAEALALTRAERPDVVITDILMPTMDGYEFVQKLRRDPGIAHTRVIFYSATYSLPEAEAMAASCGVKTILPKPADARVIIEAVGRELAETGILLNRPLDVQPPPPAAANFPATLDPGLDACLDSMRATTRLIEELMRRNDPIFSPGGHLQPLSHRLSENLLSLERTATRLNALEDLSLLLISERSPRAIVNRFAPTAARLMGAEHVAVCMLDAREAEIAWMGGHGVDLEALRTVALDRTRLPGSLLEARGVVRLATRFPDARRLPRSLTGPGGFLGLPISSADRTLGWACFAARSDGEAFSEDDERLAASMTTRLAAAYEGAILYETVQHHAAQLQLAITERERSSAELRESEQRFRQIAENIREVFWLTDPSKKVMLYISPAYREIWGRDPGALYSSPKDWLEAIHPEDRGRVAEAARTKQIRGDYDEVYRIVRPDGSIRWIEDKAFPVADANGSVYRVAGIAEDVTERRRAEAELSRINRALTMLSNCNEALIRADDESALLERICRIVVETGGYRSARVAFMVNDPERTLAIRAAAGQLPDFLRSMHISWDPDRPDGHGPASRAVQSGRPVIIEDLSEEPELRHRTQDIVAAALGRGIYLPLRGADGPFAVLALHAPEEIRVGSDELKLLQELADDLAFGVMTIRSRREREQAGIALRSSLQEKEALLKEVHHRVKNNMQVVDSLLRLESSRIEAEATKDVLRNMQNRIRSMAVLHEILYRSGNFAQVDLSVYLRQLAGQMNRALAVAPGHISFLLDLAPVSVDLEQAIPCGLVFSELASNAVKHGFSGGKLGTVWIDLRAEPDRMIRLRIRDDGPGLPADWEERRSRSLGLQLVADLTKQLGGELVVGPGSSFELSFRPPVVGRSAPFQP